jgi:S-adenosylmethionine hydrolase
MFPVIVLLTDFGLLDPYVGQMKGALLCAAPQARIVDLCHEVRAHDAVHAGFLLQASHRHFPTGSVFVCVVDPGVGSGRGILLARHEGRFFLAPDNGLLSFLIEKPVEWWRVRADAPAASRTFHGRDIFAPVAARIALGTQPQTLGAPLGPEEVVRAGLDWAEPAGAELRCRVLHVDRFGNCLLGVRAGHPLPAGTWAMDDGRPVLPASTYADLEPGQVGLIEGSQGVMELAVNGDSCARLLGLSPGDAVRLTRTDVRP